jgi:hypothetical protein
VERCQVFARTFGEVGLEVVNRYAHQKDEHEEIEKGA